MLNALRTENSPFSEQQIRQLQTTMDGLSLAQSQWLSGYLAGRLADSLQCSEESGTAGGQELAVVYATETGNSESIANQMISGLEQQGIKAEIKAMGDLRPAGLRKLKHVVFIISTHGEGDPPDEALEFFEYLDSDRAPDLSGLNYRILALGDRSYHRFCEAGRKLDERLSELGARSWGDRVECDVDYESTAKNYTDEIIQYARNTFSTGAPSATNATPNPGHLSLVSNESCWNRSNPFNARVEQVQKITGTGSDKDIYHIELSLKDAGLDYTAGDALGVWARNDPQLVGSILAALKIGPSEIVSYKEQDMTISTALTDHLEITRLTSDTVTAYAGVTHQKDFESFFSGLQADEQQRFIKQRQLADLAEEYPARLPAQELVEILRPLAPRSYSIASSKKAVDEEVHLTVATLKSNANGTDRQGVASGFLNQRISTGEKVGVFLEPNNRFRLPEDPGTPLIMIAAGTGIAPYRAFMQELEERGSSPDTWLIFGNPHLRTDFLYQREWLRWRENGLLDRIDTAWSRDQADKHYVQDVIIEQAATIDGWLKRGASIYLCGALQMGKAVLEALSEALATRRRINTGEAAAIISELRREGRIKKDLY